CKSARLIDRPETIAPLLEEALLAAVAPRPGPVHLTFPMDVQRAEAPSGERIARRLREPQSRSPAPLYTLPASYSRPLLIAGSGVFYAQKEQALARFCEKSAVPVVTPIWNRGCVNQAIPQFLGVIGAASGGPRLLPDADLVLLCGAAADYRLDYIDDARVVRVEPEHLASLELAPTPDWLAECQRRRNEFRRRFEASAVRSGSGTHALDIVA